jgi:phospholipid-binding lipoprotein MlaA
MLRKLVFALLIFASGCASTPDADPRDPLEPMNRAIFEFNDTLDRAVARPVATAYRDVVPGPARNWVRNFFGNIADVFIGFNNIIQGKPDDGLQDWVRVLFNTTFGVFGINDVASDMGLEKHNEDFGQTFGRWGVGDGPFLMLPVLGPSTLRDGVGTAVDYSVDPVGRVSPVWQRNSAVVLRFTGTRADLLDAGRLLEEAALDKYVFLRDAYLQRRRSLIYDGEPPREREERPKDEEDEKAPAEEKAPRQEKKSSADTVNAGYASNVNGSYENNR